MPKALKIHQSVMYGMGLHSRSSKSSSALSGVSVEAEKVHQRLLNTYNTPIDLTKSALVISSNKQRASLSTSLAADLSHLRASASASSATNPTSEQHGARLQAMLATDNPPVSSLALLAGDHSHSAHDIWTQTLRQASATPQSTSDVHSAGSSGGCAAAFSKLQFDSSASNRVTIRNLKSIENVISSSAQTKAQQEQVAQMTQSCFVQLLAVIATDPETIDVRFRHPQRKMNNVIKGIVQAKSRTQDYPYLNLGLDGTNQVVGLVRALLLLVVVLCTVWYCVVL